MNNEMIPLSIPNLNGNELKYITKAVEDQWVSTAGGSITEFENKFAEYLNAKEAVACQSGTAGLHLCLRHFNVGQNDIVLVPTLTFIATINAVMYQNATPVFFDCDEHLCMDTAQVKAYLENECEFDGNYAKEKISGKTVKAIMPVHVFGDVTKMKPLMELSEKYNLKVIEDATESLGSIFDEEAYKGMHTGTVGHGGVFSFNGNKIITTGGGGMIVSNDKNALDHMRYLSQQAKDDTLYFVHNEFGYNYRMTNLQAAMGIAQLEQLDDFIKIKNENYKYYCEKLSSCSFGKILPFGVKISNNWFYSFVLNEPDSKLRDEIIHYMINEKIQVRPIWKLNHTQTPFVNYRAMPCPKAEAFYNKVINLPCSTNLKKEQIDRVCETLMNFKQDK